MPAAWLCAGCHRIRGAGFVPFMIHPGAAHAGRKGDKWYPQNSAHLKKWWQLLIIFGLCIHFVRYFWPCYCPDMFNKGAAGTVVDKGGESRTRGENASVLWEESGNEKARGTQL